MRIRQYSQGKFYLIECPNGTRVVRCALRSVPDSAEPHDVLVILFRGQELVVPSDPPELLPLLAESGRFGLSQVGEPVPGARTWLAALSARTAKRMTRVGCQLMTARKPFNAIIAGVTSGWMAGYEAASAQRVKIPEGLAL